MADGTKIEWTDATWNPITGCSVVSAGCTNCYAMKLAGTRMKHHPSREGLTIDTKAGPVWNGRVTFNAAWLDQPMRWARSRRIFVCAHGDLFHETVPDHWIDCVFAVMTLCPQHVFQVLTKRAGRMRAYMDGLDAAGGVGRVARFAGAMSAIEGMSGRTLGGVPFVQHPLPNVWLGVSVENRAAMLERAPELAATSANIRFWSAEPLIDDLGDIPFGLLPDWIIAGGESGASARPMHPDWVRSLRDQCATADVPFFFKQWGEFAPTMVSGDQTPGSWRYPQDDPARLGTKMDRIGKKAAGRRLDGVEHDEMPA